MRLTTRSEYGLLALIDIAGRTGEGPVSARAIADRQGIPLKFLEQLFAALRRAGVLTAVRGARGGFELSRDPGSITVLQVVEALEGPLSPTVCDGERPCGRNGECAAGALWSRATDALRSVLVATTLAELARDQRGLDVSRSRRDGGNPT